MSSSTAMRSCMLMNWQVPQNVQNRKTRWRTERYSGSWTDVRRAKASLLMNSSVNGNAWRLNSFSEPTAAEWISSLNIREIRRARKHGWFLNHIFATIAMECTADIARIGENKTCCLKTCGRLLGRSWPIQSEDNGHWRQLWNPFKNSSLNSTSSSIHSILIRWLKSAVCHYGDVPKFWVMRVI